MEYTKGDWKATFRYPFGVYATDGKRPPTTTPIAQMIAPDQSEMEANAHLIAAAPDLYKACKLARHYLESRPGKPTPGMRGILNELIHALPKVREE